MKELRAALDQLGSQKGRRYLLTSAVGSAPSKINNVNYQELFQAGNSTLDLVFAMTYDYYGAWDGVRGHSAGLYEGASLNQGFYGAATITNLKAAGVPAANLVLGVAMYGRAWEGVSSDQPLSLNLNDASGRPFSLEYGMWEAGVMDYKYIVSRYRNDPSYIFQFDSKAKAPYLWSPSLKKVISYEDPCSAKAKMDFAKQEGLAGVFAWEIDADNGDILNVMNGGLPSCP